MPRPHGTSTDDSKAKKNATSAGASEIEIVELRQHPPHLRHPGSLDAMLAVILALEALALNPSKAFAPAKTHASKPQLSFAAPAAQQRRVVPPYMQV